MNGNEAARHATSDRVALATPIPLERAIVPYAPRPSSGHTPAAHQPASACFLASLIASAMNAETVRSRRQAPAAIAAARYRTVQSLTAA